MIRNELADLLGQRVVVIEPETGEPFQLTGVVVPSWDDRYVTIRTDDRQYIEVIAEAVMTAESMVMA